MSNWSHKIHIGTKRLSLRKTIKIGRIFLSSGEQLAEVKSATFSGVKQLLRQTGLVPTNLVINKKDTYYAI
ncbi:hypothetical protein GW933_04070 [Candidatus Falkowbacteria bacterium]|uniref:Uncharacterized protein n=1 Tax=Candidatus Buchananbacteria bacterium CG10_big_fil_rev_8_21_14_0_10_33_19 TaxID=1974525 RepID=A0A2H0W582_9BACT|nr:hypothetical protein [Candidatus Falkowbacteria bacterium]PIS06484.1 MAG: hypothetical protein COT80_00925 [Candidatus Buchananbacteria bacterium CG10_big_fil_rev_8_21_14_0_10_33_19]